MRKDAKIRHTRNPPSEKSVHLRLSILNLLPSDRSVVSTYQTRSVYPHSFPSVVQCKELYLYNLRITRADNRRVVCVCASINTTVTERISGPTFPARSSPADRRLCITRLSRIDIFSFAHNKYGNNPSKAF